MKTLIKKTEIEIYLDYVNNYLTVAIMAENYQLPQQTMFEKITTGKYKLHAIIQRREEIRVEIRKECVSYGEIAELTELCHAGHIDSNDIELLQWCEPEHEQLTTKN